MLNFFSPHVRSAGGVEPMNTLYRMNVLVSFTSLLVIQPRRKVRSAWIAGSERLYRILMRLYMVMESTSALKPLYTRKALMGMILSMIPSWVSFLFF